MRAHLSTTASGLELAGCGHVGWQDTRQKISEKLNEITEKRARQLTSSSSYRYYNTLQDSQVEVGRERKNRKKKAVGLYAVKKRLVDVYTSLDISTACV